VDQRCCWSTYTLFRDPAALNENPAARAEIDTIVGVTTWGTQRWEFANFTDGELVI
jgi:hypothetical protein